MALYDLNRELNNFFSSLYTDNQLEWYLDIFSAKSWYELPDNKTISAFEFIFKLEYSTKFLKKERQQMIIIELKGFQLKIDSK